MALALQNSVAKLRARRQAEAAAAAETAALVNAALVNAVLAERPLRQVEVRCTSTPVHPLLLAAIGHPCPERCAPAAGLRKKTTSRVATQYTTPPQNPKPQVCFW
mgnify:CR=1 FL=1